VDPTTDDPLDPHLRLLHGRAKILYSQGNFVLLATVVTAAVVAWGFWPHAPRGLLLGWLATQAAVCLGRFLLVRRWVASRPPLRQARRWIRRYLTGAALSGLTWGAAAFLMEPVGSAPHQVFLYVVLGAVGAGGVAVLSAARFGFVIFGTAALLPMAVRLIAAGDATHAAMGSLLALLFGVLALASNRIHRTVDDALRLRHENRELVTRLTASNLSLREAVDKRERINRGLRQRDAILQAVSFAAARLLKTRSWIDEVAGILSRLGTATRVSRVYIFRVSGLDGGEPRVSQLYEWTATGVAPQIDNPELQDLGFAEVGMGRWLEVLGAGGVISGPLSELPAAERQLLAAQDIRSVAVVPVFVRDEWWGFLGFDDCVTERAWSPVETDALRAAADTFGAAIQGQLSEHALRRSEERFRLLAEHTRDMVCLHEPSGRYLYVSPSCEALLGYRPEELVGRDPYELFLPEDRERIRRESHEVVLRGEQSHTVAYRIRRKSGETVWLETVTEPVLDEEGTVVQLVTSSRDVTERKRAEEQLFYEKELAQVTLQSIGDGVITTDAAGLITHLNPVAEMLTGWQSASALGRPLSEVFLLVDETRHRPVEDLVGSILRDEDSAALPEHAALLGPGGREFAIQVSAGPIRDGRGRTLGTVTVFRDVTKTRELAQQLSYQATHDALTGLINRREFDNRLRRALTRAAEDDVGDVLCYLDLDQFKVVNDTCGHVAGDEMLRQLATFLQSRVRRDDTLARLGGDEFGILLHRCPLQRAGDLAGELCRGIREFRFSWKGRVFVVGASIGLVSIDGELESVADILRAADTACYAAKDRGRNRVQVYKPDDSDLARRQGEMQWVSRLHDALAADRFQLDCQPIQPPGADPGGVVGGVEILVSMRDEHGERVAPGTFIPAAERYNLMPSIDRWVVRRTFDHFAVHWREHPPNGAASCFINLSGTTLMDDSFLTFVEAELERHGVPPHAVCFEITETAAIANLAEATRFMQRLKRLGCRFALDDFGSGLSSFAHLKALPVDYLKIDGTFVRDIEIDSVDYAMVDAINRIGHLLGLATIAEYVETPGILDKVAALGVDLVQGFAVGRPQPVAEMMERLSRG